MTHKTKGIVLKTIHYNDSSIIVSIFTELFGNQKYILKGLRKNSKTNQNKISFFQPGSILDLEVYKNDLKELQFIKEFNWHYRYQNIYFNVLKNCIAIYFIELFSHSVTHTEPNEELYDFLEYYLTYLDEHANEVLSDLSLYYTLHLSKIIGFQINGKFTSIKNTIDLQEGIFVENAPGHAYYMQEKYAQITSEINDNLNNKVYKQLHINRKTRQELLNYYELYFTLHIENFNKLKSLLVLKNLL